MKKLDRKSSGGLRDVEEPRFGQQAEPLICQRALTPPRLVDGNGRGAAWQIDEVYELDDGE